MPFAPSPHRHHVVSTCHGVVWVRLGFVCCQLLSSPVLPLRTSLTLPLPPNRSGILPLCVTGVCTPPVCASPLLSHPHGFACLTERLAWCHCEGSKQGHMNPSPRNNSRQRNISLWTCAREAPVVLLRGVSLWSVYVPASVTVAVRLLHGCVARHLPPLPARGCGARDARTRMHACARTCARTLHLALFYSALPPLAVAQPGVQRGRVCVCVCCSPSLPDLNSFANECVLCSADCCRRRRRLCCQHEGPPRVFTRLQRKPSAKTLRPHQRTG